VKEILIFLIKIYKKYLSPLLPDSCRFYPTCSEYAIEALRKYGVLRGSIKSIYRILRCNPFNKGGYDPVR
jgi:putative membrane protein insertion efficiency factor